MDCPAVCATPAVQHTRRHLLQQISFVAADFICCSRFHLLQQISFVAADFICCSIFSGMGWL